MRQCGGFYIKPKHEKHKEELRAAVQSFLNEREFESDNFWAEFLTENIDVDYETFIDYEDYSGAKGTLFVDMCNAIASDLPKIPFDGVSHYCNCNAGYNEDYLVQYDGERNLTIYSLEYFDGDEDTSTPCPDCGGNVTPELWDGALKNVIPETVYCSTCDKNFKFTDVATKTEVRV